MDDPTSALRTKLLEAGDLGRRLSDTVDLDNLLAEGRRRRSTRRRRHRARNPRTRRRPCVGGGHDPDHPRWSRSEASRPDHLGTGLFHGAARKDGRTADRIVGELVTPCSEGSRRADERLALFRCLQPRDGHRDRTSRRSARTRRLPVVGCRRIPCRDSGHPLEVGATRPERHWRRTTALASWLL